MRRPPPLRSQHSFVSERKAEKASNITVDTQRQADNETMLCTHDAAERRPAVEVVAVDRGRSQQQRSVVGSVGLRLPLGDLLPLRILEQRAEVDAVAARRRWWICIGPVGPARGFLCGQLRPGFLEDRSVTPES